MKHSVGGEGKDGGFFHAEPVSKQHVERERERVRGLTSGGRFKSPPRCDPSRESLPRRISGAINLVVVKILEGALDRPGVKYDSALN